MSQIDELQRRITAALDRIGQGLDGVGSAGSGDAQALEALTKELEDEKLVSLQLEERLKALSQKQKERAAAEEGARAEQANAMRKLDHELQSLRKANQQLRDNNKALREANEAGVTEPHLINKSMLAELEGLRAARAADRAEADLVMADLSRLIAGAAGVETSEAEDA
ncbi:hypothetical protein [Roseovarius aestuarii]|uniref:Uncharacterized protein n=1 Tax=Roseovarius aestuarii TaxID=475083 RepID=A0A1X7BRF7_9RHOB|nr:hypothetical protein [Roseovarius aestuarii]SMC11769.1 hypothetical protein ROA7745_01588 [Roseovarius aestuarii]